MNKLVTYLRDSFEELKKVTWPTRKQTLNYSLAVVALSILVAVFIGALDYGFSLGFEKIISLTEDPAGVTADVSAEPIQIDPSDIKVDASPVTTTPVK